mmetsp:Transcript_109293/g.303977  ORF Transcript_109293/g.303977 Transcript_109293/m.303977 type:complete len:398 (-) Transcript_109293:81-1274(-)
MLLQRLELVEAAALLKLGRERVLAVAFARIVGCAAALPLRERGAGAQDGLQTLECHGDDFWVRDVEDVAQGADGAVLHQMHALLRRAATRGVANAPRRLLAHVEGVFAQLLDDGRPHAMVDQLLDLLRVARRDVAQRPHGLLADALLGVAQKRAQHRDHARVDGVRRLQVVARHDVADGAQGRRDDLRRSVRQVTRQAGHDACVQDSLDAVVLAVAHVGQGPQGIRQHLLVRVRHQLGQDRDERGDGAQIRLWLAAAQVAQRPRRVAQHGQFVRTACDALYDRRRDARTEDHVAHGTAVARDVAQGPDALLADIVVRGRKQSDELLHRTCVHDHARLLARARRDVGKGPCRLELDLVVVVAAEQLDQARHEAAVDHGRDRRVALDRQHAPHACQAHD